MRSRWTDFLTTDGEKPDRDRESEFVNADGEDRRATIERWRRLGVRLQSDRVARPRRPHAHREDQA